MKQPEVKPLTEELQGNVAWIKEAFSYPKNHALRVRDVFVPFINREGTVLYIDGVMDTLAIQQYVVEPLLKYVHTQPLQEDQVQVMVRRVITGCSVALLGTDKELIQDLLMGNTIVMICCRAQAISIETPGFEARTIGEPKVEHALKGPKESFVESAATNLSQIRRRLKTQNLIAETISLGKEVRCPVTLLYMRNLTNPELVRKVKERIKVIESDSVQNLSMLEQYIEDRPYSIIPSTLTTERPDRTCAFLQEGHVVLIMDNSPYAMIAPITFWSLFHTAEDMNLRWVYGNFIRIVRIFAIFVALLTPSIYIAVSTFHEEMLQTDLSAGDCGDKGTCSVSCVYGGANYGGCLRAGKGSRCPSTQRHRSDGRYRRSVNSRTSDCRGKYHQSDSGNRRSDYGSRILRHPGDQL